MAGWDFAKIVATKTAALVKVPMIMDREWGRRLGEAQLRAAVLQEQAQRSPSDTTLLGELEELNAEIEALSDERDDKVCTFVFKSIPPDRYERIVKAHPPTQAQRTRAAKTGRQTAFNEDTFPPALVAACLVDPRLTNDQVNQLWDGGGDDVDSMDPDAPIGARFNSAELGALFMGAQEANTSRDLAE